MPDSRFYLDDAGHLRFERKSENVTTAVDLATFDRADLRAMADFLGQQDFGEQPGDTDEM